jgi:hypothetical protein
MQPANPTKPIIDAIKRMESKYEIRFNQLSEADFMDGNYPEKYGENPICFEIEIGLEDGVTISSSTTIGYCYFEHNVDSWLVAFEAIEHDFHQLLEEMDAKPILRGWKLKQLLQ